MQEIYLDNNSTTPLFPEVAAAMREAAEQYAANPGSQHAAGRRARRAIEAAREGIGEILGADLRALHADRVIFTSGGTEANNLAIAGLCRGSAGSLVVSAIEHPSVAGLASRFAAAGWHVAKLPVDAHGVVQIDRLAEQLTPQTRLVSVMLGNNETGALQPVPQIAQICAGHGVLLHTDAVQVVGKQAVHFRQLGVDTLSAAAHKFHGPCGIGVLLVKHGVPVEPLLHGGFQQAGLRPGTESVALAVGMHTALRLWHDEQNRRTEHLRLLRDRLERNLMSGATRSDPTVPMVINASGTARLPHTSSVAFPGLDRQALAMALDLAGVACSTGSACASGSSEASPTLVAMGLPSEVLRSTIRLSVGHLNRLDEIDEASTRILKVVNDLWRQKTA